MSSSLRVNTIVPSTGTNVAIGTANGTVTFTDSVNFVLGTGSSIFSPASNTLTFGTNDAERLRITSDGKIGINQASPGAMLQVDYDEGNSQVGLRLRAYNASGSKTWQLSEINGEPGVFTIRNATNAVNALNIDAVGRIGTNDRIPSDYNDPNLLISGDNATLTIMGDGSTNNSSIAALKFRVAGASTGDYTKAGIFAKRMSGYNDLAMIFAMDTAADANGVNLGNEKMRLTSAGDLGIGDSDPNSNYGTNLSVHSTATDGARLKLSDGTSGKGNTDGFDLISTGGVAYILNRENADMSFSTNNTEGMRLYANGKIHLGNSHIASNNLTRLHVGWNTGGTVAGESIIAGTLGNDTSAVSALLTMKNAGNRGAQGASGGSPLPKFEFNNGTAFEIDKYGRRTLQYQPACKVSIDTNSTGGGNNTQTGKTILPFNSTGFGYNVGNHFNTSNHTFTAPLAGRYVVLLSVNVIGDNIVYIYKNGTANMGGEYRSNPTGPWEHCELCGVIDCSANDTIQAYSYLLSSSGGRKFNGGSNPGSTWDTLSIYYLG